MVRPPSPSKEYSTRIIASHGIYGGVLSGWGFFMASNPTPYFLRIVYDYLSIDRGFCDREKCSRHLTKRELNGGGVRICRGLGFMDGGSRLRRNRNVPCHLWRGPFSQGFSWPQEKPRPFCVCLIDNNRLTKVFVTRNNVLYHHSRFLTWQTNIYLFWKNKVRLS